MSDDVDEVRRFAFSVVGVPQPQGSTRAFIPKGWQRPIITSDNPNVKDWRRIISDAAGEVATGEVLEGAITLRLAFTLPRPQSLSARVVAHTKKPDLDKLARAVKDALKKVIYRDDSQVVELIATKQYGAPVGVQVVIEERPAMVAKMRMARAATPALFR